jgi:hypothetical protein
MDLDTEKDLLIGTADYVVQRMMAQRPEERYAIPVLVAGALRHFAAGAAGRPGSSPDLALPKPSTRIMDLSARRSVHPLRPPIQ